MAKLTLGRWVLAIALTVGLLLVLRPARPLPDRDTWFQYGTADSANYYRIESMSANARLAQRRLADSLQRTAMVKRSDTDRLVVPARLPMDVQSRTRSQFEYTLRELGPRRIPVTDVYTIGAFTGGIGSFSTTVAYALRTGAAMPCLIQQLSQDRAPYTFTAARFGSGTSRLVAFAACGFSSRFGQPSPSMRRFMAANDFAWSETGPAARRRALPRRWNADLSGGLHFQVVWAGRDGDGTDEVAAAVDNLNCSRGIESACAGVIARHERAGAAIPDTGLYVSKARFIGQPGRRARVATGRLLAELAFAMGDDRFQKLWTDPRPVPVAYEAIMGEPLARWMARYLSFSMAEPPAGPHVVPKDVAAIIGCLILVLGISAMFARTWRPAS